MVQPYKHINGFHPNCRDAPGCILPPPRNRKLKTHQIFNIDLILIIMKFWKYIGCLLFVFLFVNCSDDKSEPPTEEPIYYVKIEGSIKMHQGFAIVGGWGDAYTTINGETFKESVSGEFSLTYGPFKKDFNVIFKIETDLPYSSPSCKGSISVCRGAEPFAIKTSGTGGDNLTLNYSNKDF